MGCILSNSANKQMKIKQLFLFFLECSWVTPLLDSKHLGVAKSMDTNTCMLTVPMSPIVLSLVHGCFIASVGRALSSLAGLSSIWSRREIKGRRWMIKFRGHLPERSHQQKDGGWCCDR